MRRRALLFGLAVVALALLAGERALEVALRCLVVLVVAHLILVALRRVAFTLAALADAPPAPDPPDVWPPLGVLIPCRDEAAALPATLAAWDMVDYERDRLHLVLIDDNSTDATPTLLADFAASRPWVTVLRRDQGATGKGAALMASLEVTPDAEAVAVFDADARPAADCLRHLVTQLADPGVAAVGGRMIPTPHRAPAAVYAAVEAAVHQRLTLTGAARVGATTALLGSAYAVRRDVLDALSFAPDHRLEDIDLSARLLAGGFRVLWEPRARCEIQPPASTADLGAQRVAWSRGFHRVLRDHGHALAIGAPTWPLAVDRLVFFGGYLDRLSWLVALALALSDLAGYASLGAAWWLLLAVTALLPLVQIPIALIADHWPVSRIVAALPALALVAVDVASEWLALAADVLGRPLRWRKTKRAPTRKES